jgi:hypothetical protein
MKFQDFLRLLLLSAKKGGFRGMVQAKTIYQVECFGPDGKLKWRDGFENLVVTEGLNELLDRLCKNIPGSVAWYVGLKGTGTVSATDTMASHAGWSELVPYSDATRPPFNPGTISGGSVDNSASKAVFNINGSATVAGCLLSDDNTKSGTSGTLYGAGDFAASRDVQSGDTLNVQVTLQVTAA